ncbi:MAG: type II toxin-antitoxin system HicB family antitoxin [Synergistaceae bacterium]|nr:type II toxin-antitoxin system HicB family antitoxin [Synergistaceae bacterium]
MKHPDYYMYPAVFQNEGDMWTVTFPDIDNAFTSADTLEEAIIDAQAVLEDCMYFREEQNDEIPKPSRMSQLSDVPRGFIQRVVAVMKPVRNAWRNAELAEALA